MITRLSIGLDDAQNAAAAVFAAAKAAQGPIAVAVTDAEGNLVFLERQDGTSAVDVRNAERKAYTAGVIGRDTSMFRLQITMDGRTVADWSDPMVTTLPGGWTLRRQSQVIGGIGVSGTGDDERLALAGAEAAAKISVDEWRKQRNAPGEG